MKANLKLLKGLVIAAIVYTVVCIIASLFWGLEWICAIIGALMIFSTYYNLKYHQKHQ